MLNTVVRKQMIPKKAREAQETKSHGIGDTQPFTMAKLRITKSYAKAIKCTWTLF